MLTFDAILLIEVKKSRKAVVYTIAGSVYATVQSRVVPCEIHCDIINNHPLYMPGYYQITNGELKPFSGSLCSEAIDKITSVCTEKF